MADLNKLLQMAAADTISDEMLAAYIEGNTTAEENAMIESSAPIDELDEITDIVEETQSIDDIIHFYDGDYGYWELGIPPVLDINDNSNHLTNNSMEREIYFSDAHFGEEPLIDVSGEVYQWYNDTCAIKSQQLVLEQFGIEVPQEMLIEIAENNGWYHVNGGSGTPMNCIGNLLEYYNIPSTSVIDANVGNIVAELAQGHQIIVGVDSGELHNNSILESIKDFFIGDTPDHALIVAGIDLNDPDNPYVVLKDPGTGDVAKPYPLEQFMDAWKDSSCFMVSTDIPTPTFELQHNLLDDIGGVSIDEFLSANDIHNLDHMSFSPESLLNPDFGISDLSGDVDFGSIDDSDIESLNQHQNFDDGFGLESSDDTIEENDTESDFNAETETDIDDIDIEIV